MREQLGQLELLDIDAMFLLQLLWFNDHTVEFRNLKIFTQITNRLEMIYRYAMARFRNISNQTEATQRWQKLFRLMPMLETIAIGRKRRFTERLEEIKTVKSRHHETPPPRGK